MKDYTNKLMPDQDLDFGILPDLLSYALRQMQITVSENLNVPTYGLDISTGQLFLLVLLDANPGQTAASLARASQMDKSSLTPFLTRLEAQGYVDRMQSRSDKRSLELYLTDSGRSLVAVLKARTIAYEAQLSRLLGAEKFTQLRNLLAEADLLLR
jgi:DNA-binding MarR family transcriptional regulator